MHKYKNWNLIADDTPPPLFSIMHRFPILSNFNLRPRKQVSLRFFSVLKSTKIFYAKSTKRANIQFAQFSTPQTLCERPEANPFAIVHWQSISYETWTKLIENRNTEILEIYSMTYSFANNVCYKYIILTANFLLLDILNDFWQIRLLSNKNRFPRYTYIQT